jgi:hypothetical protein
MISFQKKIFIGSLFLDNQSMATPKFSTSFRPSMRVGPKEIVNWNEPPKKLNLQSFFSKIKQVKNSETLFYLLLDDYKETVYYNPGSYRKLEPLLCTYIFEGSSEPPMEDLFYFDQKDLQKDAEVMDFVVSMDFCLNLVTGNCLYNPIFETKNKNRYQKKPFKIKFETSEEIVETPYIRVVSKQMFNNMKRIAEKKIQVKANSLKPMCLHSRNGGELKRIFVESSDRNLDHHLSKFSLFVNGQRVRIYSVEKNRSIQSVDSDFFVTFETPRVLDEVKKLKIELVFAQDIVGEFFLEFENLELEELPTVDDISFSFDMDEKFLEIKELDL